LRALNEGASNIEFLDRSLPKWGDGKRTLVELCLYRELLKRSLNPHTCSRVSKATSNVKNVFTCAFVMNK